MSTPASVLDELGLSDGRSRTPPGALDLGGTIRTRTAGETLQAIRPLFPRLGITRLADVTGMDSIGVPVAMCIRPNARHLSVSQGKGVSSELAMVSAAMESVEMYHAEHLGPPDLTAAWEGLDRASVRPGDLELGIRHQAHRDREEIGWVEAAELLSGRPILVPHVLLDLDSSRTHPDTGLFAVSSNGLASGNCLLEAVLHGLYEVVERDADLRFSNLDPDVHESRRLSLEHTGAAVIDDLVERLRDDPTVRLDAWDITTNVDLPCFRATLRDSDTWRNLGSFVGTGCHRSAVIALARALTEAAQTRLTLIAGSRDDVFPSYSRRRPAAAGPDLLPGPRRLTVDPDPHPPSPSLPDDLDHVLDRLRAVGTRQVVVVDHTDPMLGVAVVKVIVPSLRMRRLEP